MSNDDEQNVINDKYIAELKSILEKKEYELIKSKEISMKINKNATLCLERLREVKDECISLTEINKMIKTTLKLEQMKNRLLENEINKLKDENKYLLDINKNLVDINRCNVCYVNAKDIIIIPCGHYSCCSDCIVNLVGCPVCRTNIEGKLNVYDV